MADVRMDSNNKDLEIIHIQMLYGRQAVNRFLTIAELPNGTAIVIQTFEMAMQSVGVNDIVSLGSDGASVYTGVPNDVVVKLKQSIPWLLGIHCTVLLTIWNWHSLMDSERNTYFF